MRCFVLPLLFLVAVAVAPGVSNDPLISTAHAAASVLRAFPALEVASWAWSSRPVASTCRVCAISTQDVATNDGEIPPSPSPSSSSPFALPSFIEEADAPILAKNGSLSARRAARVTAAATLLGTLVTTDAEEEGSAATPQPAAAPAAAAHPLFAHLAALERPSPELHVAKSSGMFGDLWGKVNAVAKYSSRVAEARVAVAGAGMSVGRALGVVRSLLRQIGSSSSSSGGGGGAFPVSSSSAHPHDALIGEEAASFLRSILASGGEEGSGGTLFASFPRLSKMIVGYGRDAEVVASLLLLLPSLTDDIAFCDRHPGSDGAMMVALAKKVFSSEAVPTAVCSRRLALARAFNESGAGLESLSGRLIMLLEKARILEGVPGWMQRAMVADLSQLDLDLGVGIANGLLGAAAPSTSHEGEGDDDEGKFEAHIPALRAAVKEAKAIFADAAARREEAVSRLRAWADAELAAAPSSSASPTAEWRAKAAKMMDDAAAFLPTDGSSLFSSLLSTLTESAPSLFAPGGNSTTSSSSSSSTLPPPSPSPARFLRDLGAQCTSLGKALQSRAGTLAPIAWRQYTCKSAMPHHRDDPFVRTVRGVGAVYLSLGEVIGWVGKTIVPMWESAFEAAAIPPAVRQTGTGEMAVGADGSAAPAGGGDGGGGAAGRRGESAVEELWRVRLPFTHALLLP